MFKISSFLEYFESPFPLRVLRGCAVSTACMNEHCCTTKQGCDVFASDLQTTTKKTENVYKLWRKCNVWEHSRDGKWFYCLKYQTRLWHSCYSSRWRYEGSLLRWFCAVSVLNTLEHIWWISSLIKPNFETGSFTSRFLFFCCLVLFYVCRHIRKKVRLLAELCVTSNAY